ncbi:Mitochondrial ribosome-associated GTPase 2 [Halotydeus destructor]|nr:Mitochondrial ribosome-associated GTPase 2 [Halotydeus destructor]
MNCVSYSVRACFRHAHIHCVTKTLLRTVSGYSSRDGSESESEKWRRIVSDSETGYVTAFEDADGNVILPRGKISNAIALRSKKGISEIGRGTHFVDWRRVQFTGGKGGDGCIAFLRLLCNPMAGPSGGDGGNGGHVVLLADAQTKSLAKVQSMYKSENGVIGMGKDMTGANGEHRIIPVPVGTLVKTELGEIIADLDVPGSKFVAARGGAGGKGNHYFLSEENRHPKVAEIGAKGEENTYILEMKTVAHAGFVGFPNAGKSTLLRAISRARPRVASYPFTTLNPHVGIVQFDDYQQLAVADLPGLVSGAHKNKGLGISFLKHIERCVCLMYVIDLSAEEPWEQLEALRTELELYAKGLSKRPHAIIGNKIDTLIAESNLEKLRNHIAASTAEGEVPLPVIPVSAKYGSNLKEFLEHLRAMYDLYNQPNEETDEQFIW